MVSYAPPDMPIINRLLRRRKINGNGCWLWMGAISHGYGNISITKKTHRVSRLAYGVFYNIEVPRDMHVCHRCNIPSCFNPSHLYLATQKQNMIDAFRDNLVPIVHGERTTNSRFTDVQVSEIKWRLAFERGSTRLARELDVPVGTIRAIRNGENWSRVGRYL